MNKNFQKEVSVVIPTFNEEGNIEELVAKLNSSLLADGITYEVIFVDDHSTDNTQKKITALSTIYPVRLVEKKGTKGKSYSLREGFSEAQYANIAIIDGDLQYPPEAIAPMVLKLEKFDVVVADRQSYHDTLSRRIFSKTFKLFFGKFLFGLDHDVQSGLKAFRSEVATVINFKPASPWTFDLEFLHRAREAGYSIGNFSITFSKRKMGTSKVGSYRAIFEIGLNALRVKLKRIHPQVMESQDGSMLGAGIGYKRKQFITHTTLPHTKSAIRTFFLRQKLFIGMLVALVGIGLVINLIGALQILVALLSTIYFLDVVFNAGLIFKSLRNPQEIVIKKEELATLSESQLPIYTILCPLYKEAHIIPQFLEAIAKISWPKDKLDVIFLLEEDDRNSIEVAKNLGLPTYVRVAVVPDSQPKTKPKACNYGLSIAKGEYLVIYDAEDIPDPMQLKKAYLSFQKAGPEIKCLQAKLNYHNPHQNLLTRFFTAEYSLWFDVTLTGYQSINTSIPLGGTSNHFKTTDLIKLQGWDPFNVTEDADLGVRLFKEGFRTAIIDSTTLEEANSKWGNWIRQRSRWIKGYMQTYLVHTRDPYSFIKSNKQHSLLFNLIFGGKIAFILINPLLWLATLSYFTLYAYVGPSIEKLYPSAIFYMAGTSLVFGNFLYLYYYMIGCMKREQYSLVKYIFFVPLYWLMISIAGFYALFQLILKPHYWEKTTHGLNLIHFKQKRKKRDLNITKIILIPVKYGMSLLANF